MADFWNTIEFWRKHLWPLWSQRYSFFIEEETFGNKLSLSMNEWKKKPSLDLEFYISLVREILFFKEKSQGILRKDVCGNHESVPDLLY